jgi:hypothetical protein
MISPELLNEHTVANPKQVKQDENGFSLDPLMLQHQTENEVKGSVHEGNILDQFLL